MNQKDDEKYQNEGGVDAEHESACGETLVGRCYEICIGAQLGPGWSEWLEDLEMQPCGKNRTILRGRIADQAALLGILNKLCRLNLPLISVNELKGDKRVHDTGQEGGE